MVVLIVKLYSLLLCIFMLFSVEGGQAASFDCSSSRLAPDETAICGNKKLNDADVRLATTYHFLEKNLPEDRVAEVAEEQRKWLRDRVACARDTDCIDALYSNRQQELNARINISLVSVDSSLTAGTLPYCRPEDLSVRQVASLMPGMMQSRAFMAVINSGKTACRINGAPVVVSSNNTKPVRPVTEIARDEEKHVSNKDDFVLRPVMAGRKIRARDVVGFSIWNSDGFDVENEFSSVSVRLPDADAHAMEHVFTAHYDGYSQQPLSNIYFRIKPFLNWSAFDNGYDACPLRHDGVLEIDKVLQCG